MTSLPDFLIIGAMKCGTSTLHEQLALQPGIFMTTPKEPCFFSDDEVYARGFDWYKALFNDASAGQIKGESSTHYSKLPAYPKTVDRIRNVLPNIKFVYLMRHPIDRLVSHYIHEWTQNEIQCDIDTAIGRFPDLIDFGCYNRQLMPFIKTFGEASILPVFLEKLKRDPSKEFSRVCDFLGLPASERVGWDTTLGSQNVSAERIQYSRLRNMLIDNRFITWFRRMFVPQSLRDKIKAHWQMQERPALNEDSMKKLVAAFDSDLACLGDNLGVRLDCENFSQVVSGATMSWKRVGL